jgi:hypothetical protein
VSQVEAINLATRFVQENKKEKENSTQKPPSSVVNKK